MRHESKKAVVGDSEKELAGGERGEDRKELLGRLKVLEGKLGEDGLESKLSHSSRGIGCPLLAVLCGLEKF